MRVPPARCDHTATVITSSRLRVSGRDRAESPTRRVPNPAALQMPGRASARSPCTPTRTTMGTASLVAVAVQLVVLRAITLLPKVVVIFVLFLIVLENMKVEIPESVIVHHACLRGI